MKPKRYVLNHPPTVLLTGASAGIGRATAKLLAGCGYRVFGTSRNPALASQIPGVTFLPLDVQSAASVEACVQSVLDRAGRIDILINNAGAIGPGSASEETDLQSVRALFETNFFGIVQVTNTVLPIMRRQRSGTIINISSVGGLIPAPPFFSFYAATKHALEAYTEGLRYEVRPFHIQVAMVEPGYNSTKIGGTIQPPYYPVQEYARVRCRVIQIDRAGIQYGNPPEKVAQTILRVARQQRPALRNLAGSDSQCIILARRILPHALFERLIEWMFFSWHPADRTDTIPTPQALGLHRFLFHTPTRNRTLRAAIPTAFASLGVIGGIVLFKRSRRS